MATSGQAKGAAIGRASEQTRQNLNGDADGQGRSRARSVAGQRTGGSPAVPKSTSGAAHGGLDSPVQSPATRAPRTRIRLLKIELTDVHELKPRQAVTVACLYLFIFALMGGAAVLGTVLFEHMVSVIADHSAQLRVLDPRIVVPTILGVSGFAGLSVAIRYLCKLLKSLHDGHDSTDDVED